MCDFFCEFIRFFAVSYLFYYLCDIYEALIDDSCLNHCTCPKWDCKETMHQINWFRIEVPWTLSKVVVACNNSFFFGLTNPLFPVAGPEFKARPGPGFIVLVRGTKTRENYFLGPKKVVISFLVLFLFNLAIWAQNKFHRNIYFLVAQMVS